MRLPGVCVVCRDRVEWLGGKWYDVVTKRPHHCGTVRRSQEMCGAWMPIAREYCARGTGHGNFHRTRSSLDYRLAMETGIGLADMVA